MSRLSVRVLVAIVWALLPHAVGAQVPTPTARAVRATQPPRVDGRLNDPAWVAAPVIEGFRQREPQAGVDVSEPTSVRIVYDDTTLYIGAEIGRAHV